MKSSLQKSQGEESGNSSRTNFDTYLECFMEAGIFKNPFLVFLNFQEQDGEKKRLKYGGIKKARQLFRLIGDQSLDSNWDALANAEMDLSDSVESKHFLVPDVSTPSTPKELAAYFRQPYANEWQEHELEICRGVLGNVEGHLYISVPFPLSGPNGVAHIVFDKKEKAPQIDQIRRCF